MSGHTKGPWVHYDDSNRAIPRHTVVAAGKTVTTVYCTKGQEDEDAANARLIAAAPDLLEALKHLCDVSGRSRNVSDARQKAQDAIAKAEVGQ